MTHLPKPDPNWNEDPDAALAEVEARLAREGKFYGGSGQFQALAQLPRNIALLQGDYFNLGYTNISDLGGLVELAQLKTLIVGAAVTDISVVEELPNLETFEMFGAKGTIRDLSPLGRCPQLNKVKISPAPGADLSFFQGNPLTWFELLANSNHRLPYLPNLKWLSLHAFESARDVVFDLSPMGKLDALEHLSAWSAGKGVYGLSRHMSALKSASVKLHDVNDYMVFSNCPELEKLCVTHPDIDTLRPLKRCQKLRRLELRNAKIRDIASLSPLLSEGIDTSDKPLSLRISLYTPPRLEEIDISGNPVSFIVPLSFQPKLRSIRAENTPVTSLEGWNTASTLDTLDLNNTGVRDLSPLFGSSIFNLDVSGTPVDDLTGITSIRNLRGLDISRTQVAEVPQSERHAELFHKHPPAYPREPHPYIRYRDTPLEQHGFQPLEWTDRVQFTSYGEPPHKAVKPAGPLQRFLLWLFGCR